MRQFLIVTLFIILLGDLMLGLGLGLAPGLSLKNAFLYVLFIALVLDVTIGDRDLLPEAWPVIVVWIMLIGYATFSWLAISLLGLHRGYSAVAGFISLKSQLVDFALFFLLFLFGPRDMEQTVRLAKWLVTVFVLANLVTLLDVFNIPDLGIMEDRSDSRVSGPIGSVNQYGAVLAYIIPLQIGFAVGSPGRQRAFYMFGAIISLVLLSLTISRGAFVGLTVGTLTTLYVARDHVSKKELLKGIGYGVLGLLIAAAAVAIHDPTAFLGRFDYEQATSMRDMSSGRTDIWLRALTMMSTEPITFLTGFGWDAYATLFLGYDDPHNEFLHYWFELGVFGLGAILFIVIWVSRNVYRNIDTAGPLLKPLFIGFTVGWISVLVSVFFVGLYLPWLFIWACTGTIVRLSIEVGRIKPEIQRNKEK